MEYRLKLKVYPPKLSIRSELRDPAATLRADPEDMWLCSYPKSGNTWMRFCLANLLRPGETANFTTINHIVPDIYKLNKGKLAGMPSPRFLKSHEAFRPDYRRVLYLCRDPRDVLVSYYHHCRKECHIADDLPIGEFADLFLNGNLPAGSAGSWADNVGSWLGARHASRNFVLLRYEDLFAEPRLELARVAKFFIIPYTDDIIDAAVRASAADEMRKIEARRNGERGMTKRTDIPFVREAKPGGWRQALSPAIVQKLECRWAPLMRELGYLN